jgi:hypothetical protein
MKFSIRDLFLVTVIVATGVGWRVERQRLLDDNARQKALAEQYGKEVQKAKLETENLKSVLFSGPFMPKKKPKAIVGTPRREPASPFTPIRIPRPEDTK